MRFLLLILPVFIYGIIGFTPCFSAEEEAWPGVDVAVVEKYAKEYGREPRPFINIEGDLLLFAFTVAGAAAGFVIGYNWNRLFGKG